MHDTFRICAARHTGRGQLLCLPKIPGGGYSLHEWNDALEYLLLHEACSSIEEAKQVFIGASKRLRAERLSFAVAMRKEDGVSEAEAKPREE